MAPSQDNGSVVEHRDTSERNPDEVESVRRRTLLSWSHHREVASLGPAEQDQWLGRAEAEGWTRNDCEELDAALERTGELVPYCAVCAEREFRRGLTGLESRALSAKDESET